MEIETDTGVRVRAKFIGGLLIALMLVLSFVIILRPASFLYLAGIVIPGGYLIYRCFTTKQIGFSGLISINTGRFICLGSLIFGLVLHHSISPAFAYSWYIAAAMFMFYEPVILNFFVLINLVPPFISDDDFK